MAREASARLLEIASMSVALKSEPVVGTTGCATTERSILTSGDEDAVGRRTRAQT